MLLEEKDVRWTTELDLSGQGLTSIPSSVASYIHLEVLRISRNAIGRIENLISDPLSYSVTEKLPASRRGCVGLRRLYAEDNAIHTLEGSLKHLKHLEVLVLSGNRIKDMETCVQRLRHLNGLRELDLSGNPVAQEAGYRLRMIHVFPKLDVFDKHVVTDRERESARLMEFGGGSPIKKKKKDRKKKPIAFGKHDADPETSLKARTCKDRVDRASELELSVVEESKRIRAEREAEEQERERLMFSSPLEVERMKRMGRREAEAPRMEFVEVDHVQQRQSKGDEDATAKQEGKGRSLLNSMGIEELTAQCENQFHEIDVDGNGWIDPSELARLLRRMKMPTSVLDDVETLHNVLDVDKNGRVELDEFMSGLTRWAPFLRYVESLLYAKADQSVKDGNTSDAMRHAQAAITIGERAVQLEAEQEKHVEEEKPLRSHAIHYFPIKRYEPAVKRDPTIDQLLLFFVNEFTNTF
eukprot:TRINITY_DN1299_c1_g1_i1.p1 TRINITY_DN1299_c1_g1~~TRINITY_DN1299_c1_g1_i1.p1  ORF type:complete len:469 (+),score=134.18 TRINITY_DN1299_c1_g1_i1:149-1555(+)